MWTIGAARVTYYTSPQKAFIGKFLVVLRLESHK